MSILGGWRPSCWTLYLISISEQKSLEAYIHDQHLSQFHFANKNPRIMSDTIDFGRPILENTSYNFVFVDVVVILDILNTSSQWNGYPLLIATFCPQIDQFTQCVSWAQGHMTFTRLYTSWQAFAIPLHLYAAVNFV